MNNNSAPQNYNNQKINSILKKIIIFFGVGILGLTLLLVSTYMNKKSSKELIPIVKEETSKITNFDSTCYNKEIIYKENYIAITSKTCKQIKIIVPQSNKVNIIDY